MASQMAEKWWTYVTGPREHQRLGLVGLQGYFQDQKGHFKGHHVSLKATNQAHLPTKIVPKIRQKVL